VLSGQKYSFVPDARDPDRDPLKFSVSNKPRWATFNSTDGQLYGTPTSADVGEVRQITITVTDGFTKRELPPFDLRVVASTTSVDQTQDPVATVPPPAAGPTPLRFAEVHEIVFVRGYPDKEQMGIFQLDTRNRWTPGDLENRSGWRARVDTQLNIVEGSLSGLTYDPSSAILRYDGTGSGTQTVTVTLSAPTEDSESEQFNIRILQPTIAWGDRADTRFPGIGLDSSAVRWSEMQKSIVSGASYDSPNVLLVTQGTYSDDFYISNGKRNLYIIGEPGQRPKMIGGNLKLDDVETGYLKNLELQDTVVDSSKFPLDRPVNVYYTQIYQHDSTRELNGFGSPDYEGDSRYGIAKAPGIQKHWFWNFHGAQMGGLGNLRHQFYMHGRPDGHLIINNVRIDGSRNCSIVKSTKYFNSVRNSRLSALLDESRPAVGKRADKLLDIATAGEIVLYNNELVGAYTAGSKGTQHGLITLRARRTWWGADSPAYPDVSLSPPTTSVAEGGYLAPAGFTAGPETFMSEAFWTTVRSYDLGDPNNPYSFKKFISHNTFRWIDEGMGRRSALVDDGTAPRTAKSLGSVAEIWGTVPRNWSERSVSFLANNRYIGWEESDMSSPGRWFDVETYTSESLVEFSGPGPYAYPPAKRTLIRVGGEQTPQSAPGYVGLPGWFKM
jgi:hypothetical protein